MNEKELRSYGAQERVEVTYRSAGRPHQEVGYLTGFMTRMNAAWVTIAEKPEPFSREGAMQTICIDNVLNVTRAERVSSTTIDAIGHVT
jgi:hypothetical protein